MYTISNKQLYAFDNVTIHYAHYFSKMSSFFNWQKSVCVAYYMI